MSAYDPLLRDLKGIQKGLSLDLSPAGVERRCGRRWTKAMVRMRRLWKQKVAGDLQSELADVADPNVAVVAPRSRP
jgi:hypothetical protein